MWKQFRETKYEANSNGEVRNSKTGRILKSRTDRYGYQLLTLYIEGKQLTFKVHRIVAECFIPNPINKPVVNHLDRNRSNNKVENLEWVTVKENWHHAIKEGNINFDLLREYAINYRKTDAAKENARAMGNFFKYQNLKQYRTSKD